MAIFFGSENPVVGTLNLCREMPETLKKESVWSNHPVLRKVQNVLCEHRSGNVKFIPHFWGFPGTLESYPPDSFPVFKLKLYIIFANYDMNCIPCLKYIRWLKILKTVKKFSFAQIYKRSFTFDIWIVFQVWFKNHSFKDLRIPPLPMPRQPQS